MVAEGTGLVYRICFLLSGGGGVWGLISLSGKVGCGARVSCGLVDK